MRSVLLFVLLLSSVTGCASGDARPVHCVPFRVTSELTLPKVPMDPEIDFAKLIAEAGIAGVLDPNSIAVVDATTGRRVPCAVTEDFAYSDRGRVEWVIDNPSHGDYEIRFATAQTRPALQPARRTPLIGVGDLLRYNAGIPRPIALVYPSRLEDLTGDGRRDLVGCWNYAYRPGSPWDGIVCYPRVGRPEAFEFGDLRRIRYVESADSEDHKHFSCVYMHADLADLDNDGLVDLVYSPSRGNELQLFLNSGRRDKGGMPVFAPAGAVPRPAGAWNPCRAVDLNADGAVDLIAGKYYLRNRNGAGWPMSLAEPVALDLGDSPCFIDMDLDGRLDCVCLVPGASGDVHEWTIAWRRNLDADSIEFGPALPLGGAKVWRPSFLAAVTEGPRCGILVVHNVFQNVSFLERVGKASGQPELREFGRAGSVSAVMSLSDQAWPCVCDWDADGDWDLLVGGGYGWPRTVKNNGSSQAPSFEEARSILSEGKPIRILRDEVLGGRHWHNMGYPYPAWADWDADGLPDLLLPNETNRIFWYKNVGAAGAPRFGRQRQVICDGYPDSPEHRTKSARLAGDKSVPNQPYPYEADRPFFWRTGVGLGDMNGDGLTDLITHDGHRRKLTLFVRYRDSSGTLRLKKAGPLRLSDGRLIDDSIVSRSAHWTESFRCADWDGDGLLDVVYSCAGTEAAKGSIYLLRNCGSRAEPVFEIPVTLCCFGDPIKVTSHGPHPAVADMDGDGRPDVLTCVEWSVYPFYSHTAIEMKQRPEWKLGAVQGR